MPATITQLVPIADVGDLLRDLTAAIIKEEADNQVVIAGANPPADPQDYALEVFIERRDVWEQVADRQDNARVPPVVNIWRTTGNVNPNASSRTNSKQKWTMTLAVDCYGFGRSYDDGGTGHVSADEDSAKERDRAVCLVRQFLTAPGNFLLRNRGEVWRSEFSNSEYFVPAVEDLPAPNVSACRLYFEVGFEESAPGRDTGILEYLAVDICTIYSNGNVQTDAKLAAEVDIDYTAI